MAMDGDAAPETEVPRVEDQVEETREAGEVGEAGEAGDAGEEEASGNQSKKRGKPGKRQYEKVKNLADFYAPAPYTSATKGGGGKGKSKGDGKGEFKGDREDRKGKGKGAYYQEGEAPSKGGEREKGAEESSPSDLPGPAADGGDLSQGKGGASGKKKQGQFGSAGGGGGGKSREGGKDGGGGKGRGKGAGAGQAPRKGGGAQFSSGGGKGVRGPMMPGGDMLDGGADPDSPKAPGPQQRTQLMPPKAGAPGPGGLVMAGPPGAMPLHYGAMPAYGAMPGGQMAAIPYATAMPSMGYPMTGMAGMGIMPYYVMPQPNHAGMPAQPYMPATPQQLQQPPPMSPEQRERLKTEMEKQIEYYFGMENLLKDVYLRKHMNEEGWVPISLLQGFPRIQQITHDPSILVDAITASQLIEISPQSTHMRLKNEWPRWILAPQQGASAAPAGTAAPQQRLTP